MAYDENLAGRIQDVLVQETGIVEKKMFGGVGFLLHGNMLVGIWKESLIARVGSAEYESALRERFVREFDITGRSMTGWVLVDPEAIEDDASLRQWIQRAMTFVKALPRK